MDASETVEKAKKMLENLTPLRRDCGALCGAACCRPDEDGQGGMRLYPGEVPAPFLRAEDGLAVCFGVCARDLRPLACRVFPLLPVIRNGVPGAEPDRRAWAVCPLMEWGLSALSGEFVEAVEAVAALLAQNEACRAFLEAQTGEMDTYGHF